MKKRAIIIHGWDGQPDTGWLGTLHQILEQRGFAVTAPAMPHSDRPTIKDWVGALKQAVGQPDSQLVLIGHSMGCQTILRYLAQASAPIAGSILVAGFVTLQGLVTAEEKAIAAPWLEMPIDSTAVRTQCRQFRVYLSDDDTWVPLDSNREWFKKQLSAEVIVCTKAEHFMAGAGEQLVPDIADLAQDWTSH